MKVWLKKMEEFARDISDLHQLTGKAEAYKTGYMIQDAVTVANKTAKTDLNMGQQQSGSGIRQSAQPDHMSFSVPGSGGVLPLSNFDRSPAPGAEAMDVDGGAPEEEERDY